MFQIRFWDQTYFAAGNAQFEEIRVVFVDFGVYTRNVLTEHISHISRIDRL